ncbi:Na+/H+ antiporter subunit E [Roseomonas rosulenta]|uniref:Na+/H+ antiporter subunit E n=1 Tax=Roseomonas rosulenta TaxID=2748667 RepID=UPI0018DEF2DB|nr:Na+/H+ antiporter subunit E [Roseomonas rosulenta]
MAAGAIRFALLLLAWSGITGGADLALGALSAAAAACCSLVLSPPGALRPSAPALALLVLRFPWQALRAGMDVARLALDPRRAPTPGEITWTPRLPPGPARDAFLAYASLLPGTLPAGEAADGSVIIHALTTDPAIADAMTAEEARFARAIGADA